MRLFSLALFVGAVALVTAPLAFARPSGAHAVTVEDLVRYRTYPAYQGDAVVLSPDGKRVAYILNAPNLGNDANEFLLYVRDLDDHSVGDGRLLARANSLARPQWLADNRTLLFLSGSERETNAVERVIADTGARDTLYAEGMPITDLSASADGSVVVFFRVLPPPTSRPTPAIIVDPAKQGIHELLTRKLAWTSGELVALTSANGNTTTRVLYRSPQFQPSFSIVSLQPGTLRLSPDAKHLLFLSYNAPVAIPKTWDTDPDYTSVLPGPAKRAVLLTMASGEARLAFDASRVSISGISAFRWSEDSRSYTIVAPDPVGEGLKPGTEKGRPAHLFAVEVETGRIEKIAETPPLNVFLFEANASRIKARTAEGDFVTYARTSEGWSEHQRIKGLTGKPGVYDPASLAEGTFVTVSEAKMTPPQLTAWRMGERAARRITDWNPEFASLSWGKDRVFEWRGSDGVKYEGSYILPPDHRSGERHPLVVILDATGPTEFTARAYTTSAFPPQALASRGIAVLTTRHRVYEGTAKAPGNMREAFNGMARAESGIAELAKLGFVDPARVGLMGFSRTSWLADFIATQSSFKYRAISSCDSGIYNYASYFVGDDEYRAAVDPQYGASPFTDEGMTLYRRYAPAFNAHKANAPILLQYHGVTGPVSAMEYLGALRGHKKAVELMWLPDGEHNLTRPSERVASLQANVDWFDFWLNDHEDSSPAKVEQYARWRSLRAQRDKH